MPNVLLVGDSVCSGYAPFVRAALSASANVQHGPDNSGGGNADGTGYGWVRLERQPATATHRHHAAWLCLPKRVRIAV